jgi:hypothetical protein
MTKHLVFCSACDRDVTLVPRTSKTLWRIVLASAPAVELECRNQGVSCTGALCSYAAPEPVEEQRPDAAPSAIPA